VQASSIAQAMRRRAWQRRKRLLLAAVTAAAVALGVAAYATALLYPLEAQSIDARFSIRGPRPALTKDFLIVQIDNASFNYFSRHDPRYANWPWPRRFHAVVIDHLRAAGAKVIAFDIQFTQQTDPYDDNALIEALGRARPTVLSTTAVAGNGTTGVLGGPSVQRQFGVTVGDATVRPDSQGVIRDFQQSFQGIDTFPVAIASLASGHAIGAGVFGGATNLVPIDYPGPPGTVPALSYWQVYANDFPRSAVRGKIVIVGAQASILQDRHTTPTSGSTLMDGPEIQADSAATALAGVPLRYSGDWLDVLVIVLFAAFTPLLSIRVRLRNTMLASLVLAALLTVGVQIAFDSGTILVYTYPLLAMVAAIIATLSIVLLGEAFERQHARDIFARFVPPDVVDEVLTRTDDDFRLGGVEREVTVLFSDLRGFTSFSESQPAPKVIEVVNFYLNEMTEAIMDAGGTLISYMGDGIMAVFGAPIDQPDHADRALAASREMIGPRLQRFNTWLSEQGHDAGFRMGVGLNSGLVMAGNVGAAQRVEYTAIGDTTNTASRLEGLTKGTPYMLFLSDTTRERMHEIPPDMVFVDHFEIRGRAAKMPVYSIPDPEGGYEGPTHASLAGSSKGE
jgi:adenylate cyclase